MALKSDYWAITVQRKVKLKVAFEEPLSEDDALDAYATQDFEDILDEEADVESETILLAEPLNEIDDGDLEDPEDVEEEE